MKDSGEGYQEGVPQPDMMFHIWAVGEKTRVAVPEPSEVVFYVYAWDYMDDGVMKTQRKVLPAFAGVDPLEDYRNVWSRIDSGPHYDPAYAYKALRALTMIDYLRTVEEKAKELIK